MLRLTNELNAQATFLAVAIINLIKPEEREAHAPGL
jgi:hypothetical protein